MATIQRFEDLEVWQRARELAVAIYRITKSGEFAKDFGLRDQIRRAAVSIVSNIAEGFGRRSHSQFAHFLEIASGSTSEVEAQLYVALDLGYIDEAQFGALKAMAKQVFLMTAKLLQHLRQHPTQNA